MYIYNIHLFNGSHDWSTNIADLMSPEGAIYKTTIHACSTTFIYTRTYENYSRHTVCMYVCTYVCMFAYIHIP